MHKLLIWLCGAAMLVVIFGTIYGAVQQAQRSGANYPQLQLAEDVATLLNTGTDPHAILSGQVNMASSLAPFVTIYDLQGNAVASSGMLNGKTVEAPMGILKAAVNQDYHTVTWQPVSSVRIAAVTVAANKYYVLSGRSLKEVEKNESATFQMSLLGGLISVGLLSAACWLLKPKQAA